MHLRAVDRSQLALMLLLSSACGASARTVVEHPVEETAPGPEPLDALAGEYAITGEPIEDTCEQRIYLAAEHIRVDPSARTLFADVVDRTYAARMEEGHLVAEGRFDVETACPSTTTYERWVLAPNAGGLEGELASTWQIGDDCERVCTIRFAIHASRR